MPQRLLDYVHYAPAREYKRFRQTAKVMNRVAKELIEEKTDALRAGDLSGRDAMSVLGELIGNFSPFAPSLRP